MDITGTKRNRSEFDEDANTDPYNNPICCDDDGPCECPLCMENKPLKELLPCKHYICIDCARRVAQDGNTCPMCRQTVTHIGCNEKYELFSSKHVSNSRRDSFTRHVPSVSMMSSLNHPISPIGMLPRTYNGSHQIDVNNMNEVISLFQYFIDKISDDEQDEFRRKLNDILINLMNNIRNSEINNYARIRENCLKDIIAILANYGYNFIRGHDDKHSLRLTLDLLINSMNIVVNQSHNVALPPPPNPRIRYYGGIKRRSVRRGKKSKKCKKCGKLKKTRRRY